MKLSKYIDEMAYPVSWNLETFKSLKSFPKRSQYCREHLQRLSAGTGREVFKIDDEKVLKLAKNVKGIAQNEQEVSLSNDYAAPERLLAKIFEVDENNEWIEMEYCTVPTTNDFKRYFGVRMKDFFDIIQYVYNRLSPNRKTSFWPEDKKYIIDMIKDFNENKQWWYYELEQFLSNFGYPAGDFERLSSWGKTKDGRLVIIDYGLSEQIYQDHYLKQKQYRSFGGSR